LPGEAKNLKHIHSNSVRTLAGQHYSKGIIEAWTGAFAQADIEDALNEPHTQWILGLMADEPAGFALRHGSEIRAVYVHPDQANKGLGKALLFELEQSARKEGRQTLELEASLNARPFYQKQGYQDVCHSFFTLPKGLLMKSVKMIKELS
jgi:putative acetyltransferase